MAYTRYDSNSVWYIFRDGKNGQKANNISEEMLAVWHIDHRSKGQSFAYKQILSMLQSNEYSAIPGYEDKYRQIIEESLKEFIKDVDKEYNRNG
jgi:hypothetical protein